MISECRLLNCGFDDVDGIARYREPACTLPSFRIGGCQELRCSAPAPAGQPGCIARGGPLATRGSLHGYRSAVTLRGRGGRAQGYLVGTVRRALAVDTLVDCKRKSRDGQRARASRAGRVRRHPIRYRPRTLAGGALRDRDPTGVACGSPRCSGRIADHRHLAWAPEDLKLADVGFSEKTAAAAACVTVSVCPPTVSVPAQDVSKLLAATD